MIDTIQPTISTDELRRIIERRHKAYLWGQPSMITPRLVDEVFGDGQKLIALQPIAHRPNYYVVRVDSSWSTHNSDDGPVLIDHLDDIYESIEDQFGVCDYERRKYDYFPRASFDTGSHWWELNWPLRKGQREFRWRRS